ncbi:hypothetical protein [Clostridium sp. UBA1353]|uniref:hypothetical protein n=1 Tax=Clostridium sp. UBA1353 TaxID=1946347 RepID=UPI00321679E9
MAYTKTVWKDRVVQNPRTYTKTDNADGSITLTPKPGVITEEGTPISAANMNRLEEGVESAAIIEDSITGSQYVWGIENGAVFLERVVK